MFTESATSGAGGEVSHLVPSAEHIPDIWGRLGGRSYRVASWATEANILAAATRIQRIWYGGYGLAMKGDSVVLIDDDVDRCTPLGEASVAPISRVSPPYMGLVSTTALTATDVIINFVCLEVLE